MSSAFQLSSAYRPYRLPATDDPTIATGMVIRMTATDTFPPAAPKGLSVVAAPGTMSLSWDRNTELDLGGYLVLRGEAAGETLQPLTPAPVAGTSFEDKTVTAGVRYAYAIVAVDQAVPPNRSPQSARVEETAR